MHGLKWYCDRQEQFLLLVLLSPLSAAARPDTLVQPPAADQ